MILDPERRRAKRWLGAILFFWLTLSAIGWWFSYPLGALLESGRRFGWSAATLDRWQVAMSAQYWPTDIDLDRLTAWLDYLASWTNRWLALVERDASMLVQAPAGIFAMILASASAAAIAFYVYWVKADLNHFRRTRHGFARVATRFDYIRRNWFDHTGFILAEVRGRHVRLWETLSVLLLAPPGTGKTVQLITNILADWPDHVVSWKRFGFFLALSGGLAAVAWRAAQAHFWIAASCLGLLALIAARLAIKGLRSEARVPAPSMFVNDVKGEIRDATRSWRSQLGPTYVISWFGEDDGSPTDSFNLLDPENFPGGEDIGPTRDRLLVRLREIYGRRAEKVDVEQRQQAAEKQAIDAALKAGQPPPKFSAIRQTAVAGFLAEYRVAPKNGAPGAAPAAAATAAPTSQTGPVGAPASGAAPASPPRWKTAEYEALPKLMRLRRDKPLTWLDELLQNPGLLGDPFPPGDEATQQSHAIGSAAFDDLCLQTGRQRLQAWLTEKIDGRTLADDLNTYQTRIADLQKVIDRFNTFIVPDQVEQHWKVLGRAAGTGLTLCYIERCLRLAETPSYGGLIDWITQVTVSGSFSPFRVEIATDGNGEKTLQRVSVPFDPDLAQAASQDVKGDQLEVFLKSAVQEARDYGYSDRVISELNDLLLKPDKERGSVVSTFGAGIQLFKSPKIREATSTSSFRVRDFRGWRKRPDMPRGNPITIYCVIKMDDAVTVGPLTGMFISLFGNSALSERASAVKKNGRPIQAYIDEFWSLPPSDVFRNIVTLGRGQWMQEYIVGQSFGQFTLQNPGAAGAASADVLKDAIAYTIIPTQAAAKTAKEIEEQIGNATVLDENYTKRFAKGADTVPWKGVPLFSAQRLLNLEKLDPANGRKGEQIALIYGAKAVVIEGRPPCWFDNPLLLARSKVPFKSNEAWMAELEADDSTS